MSVLKKIGLGIFLLFIAMQFYTPTKNSAPAIHTATFIKETNPSAELQALFETSCYDCHSNTTEYPWYNNIAPISYFLADHVSEGKEHLNFSEWKKYSMDKKDHLLEEIEEEVKGSKMPLKEYRWMHSDAILSALEVEELVEWVKRTRIIYQLGKQPK